MKRHDWTRLDNAALIYTSSMSDNYASKFRVSVTLDNDIDNTILNEALASVIDRFPSFRYKLKQGIFWWYFKTIKQAPIVSETCDLDPLPIKDNNGYLFKVSTDGPTINMDVFHSLADGSASMTFLLTLASDYLNRIEGTTLDCNNWVLDPREEAKEEEISDAFDTFSSNGKGSLEKGTPAYHYNGHTESHDVLHNTKISVQTSDLVSQAKNMGCTVTDLLSAAMIRSLQRIRKEDKSIFKRGDIKICVPVNLRKIFGRNTLRNFSSYVNIGVDAEKGDYSIDEIIRTISSQKKELMNPASLESKINANVKLENNIFIRMIPWPIKKIAMNIINRLKGDRLCSQTLSNLGVVTLPEQMAKHVKGLDFQLGRHLQNFGACGCVSYGGETSLNFSRKIKETCFEQYFTEELGSLGLILY